MLLRALVLLALLAGCGDDDPASRVEKLADRVCACTEPVCAAEASAELERVSKEALAERASRELVERITRANARAVVCIQGE